MWRSKAKSYRGAALARAGVMGALAAVSMSACGHRVQIKDIEPQEIETTLFLIGDAGEPDPRARALALDSLKRQASEAPSRTIIVFLGDNVYPGGHSTRQRSRVQGLAAAPRCAGRCCT